MKVLKVNYSDGTSRYMYISSIFDPIYPTAYPISACILNEGEVEKEYQISPNIV